MNGFAHTPGQLRAHCLICLGSAVIGLGSGSSRSEAAAIHHANHSAVVDSASNRTWSEYLARGPSVWATVAHPALTPAIEAQMWKSIRADPPPNTNAVVQFFEYRQSLAPVRFDHYHPRIAAALAKIRAEGATPTTAAPTSSPIDQAQQITPPNTDPAPVPEPASYLLTLAMTGYALWIRRRLA